MINPKDLSNEELINKYYHTRQDAEAYEVSKDVEMLPLLKQELKDRLSRKDYENKAGEACIALEKILSGRQATNITDDECKFASMYVEAKRKQDEINYIQYLRNEIGILNEELKVAKKGGTVSLADEVMPRKGICNKCTQSLAGMEHCRGKEMGCNCDCKCKHLDVDWEMYKERADRKRLDTGTCIKCGEQVRKVTNI